MSQQDLLTKFYNTSNLVSVDIVFPSDADWESFANAEPAFYWRSEVADQIAQEAAKKAGQKPGSQLDVKRLKRYEWYQAESVTISSSDSTFQETKFVGVAIIKKSFAGSKNFVKPSIKIDFSRSKLKADKTQPKDNGVKDNATIARNLIGTEHLTLNNSVQDDAYVRQPLGYEIFRQGKIPYARCNLAHVTVNHQKIDLGIYCNLEPIFSPYLQRNFKNDKGNLYETELNYDLDPKRFPYIKYSSPGFSAFEDQKDLQLAAAQLNQGMSKIKEVFDVSQIIRVLAMQAVVNHWDGYPNNTFFYNDTVPVQDPTAKNCKFKAIPSGIDQIYTLEADKQKYTIRQDGKLSQEILKDPQTRAEFQAALKECTGIFETNLKANLNLVDTLANLVKKVGVSKDPTKKDIDFSKQIMLLKDQLSKCVQNVSAIAL